VPFTCEANCPANSFSFTSVSTKCLRACPSSKPYVGTDGVTCSLNCGNNYYYTLNLLLRCDTTCPSLLPYEILDSASAKTCVQSCPVYYQETPTRICVSSCPAAVSFLDFTANNPTCIAACTGTTLAYNNGTNYCLSSCPADKPLADQTASPRSCVTACPNVAGTFKAGSVCTTTCPSVIPVYDITTKVCTTSCPQGSFEYPSAGNTYCDTSCPAAMTFRLAVDTFTRCLTACPSGYFSLIQTGITTCYTSCPQSSPIQDTLALTCTNLCADYVVLAGQYYTC
jgi:hypothetical protein